MVSSTGNLRKVNDPEEDLRDDGCKNQVNTEKHHMTRYAYLETTLPRHSPTPECYGFTMSMVMTYVRIMLSQSSFCRLALPARVWDDNASSAVHGRRGDLEAPVEGRRDRLLPWVEGRGRHGGRVHLCGRRSPTAGRQQAVMPMVPRTRKVLHLVDPVMIKYVDNKFAAKLVAIGQVEYTMRQS